MSNVLALDSAASEPEHHAHRRLRRLSCVLSWLFTTLLLLLVLYLIAGCVVVSFFSAHVQTNAEGATLFFGPHGEIPPPQPGMVRLSDQPFLTRAAGIVNLAIAEAPFIFIFWHLRALFGLYAAGTVFAKRNATHLKHVGFWLMAYPVAKFLSNLVFRAAGGLDHAWFHPLAYQAPIAGIIVVAIALVMEFGHEIEQEKDSFI